MAGILKRLAAGALLLVAAGFARADTGSTLYSNNGNYIQIKAPNGLAQTYKTVFPAAIGGVGQALTIQGLSGNTATLQWETLDSGAESLVLASSAVPFGTGTGYSTDVAGLRYSPTTGLGVSTLTANSGNFRMVGDTLELTTGRSNGFSTPSAKLNPASLYLDNRYPGMGSGTWAMGVPPSVSNSTGVIVYYSVSGLCSDLSTPCTISPLYLTGFNTLHPVYVNADGRMTLGIYNNINSKIAVTGSVLIGADEYSDLGPMPHNGLRVMGAVIATSATVNDLTALQFTKTDANKHLTSFDLFGSANNWSGAQTFNNITINGACTGAGCSTGTGVGSSTSTVVAGAGLIQIVNGSTITVKVNFSSVTALGANPTTAAIPDSADRRYMTDAQRVVLGNTAGTNSGDQDLSGLANKAAVVASTNTEASARILSTWTVGQSTQAVADALAAEISNRTLADALLSPRADLVASTGPMVVQIAGLSTSMTAVQAATTTMGGNISTLQGYYTAGVQKVANGGTGTSAINTCTGQGAALTYTGAVFGCNTIVASGGGGSPAFAVGTGTLAAFTNPVSTPTAIISFDGAIFTSRLTGASTNFISILPGLYASAPAVASDTNTLSTAITTEVTQRTNADALLFPKSGIPTCTGTDKVTGNGTAFSCAADVSGGGGANSSTSTVVASTGLSQLISGTTIFLSLNPGTTLHWTAPQTIDSATINVLYVTTLVFVGGPAWPSFTTIDNLSWNLIASSATLTPGYMLTISSVSGGVISVPVATGGATPGGSAGQLQYYLNSTTLGGLAGSYVGASSVTLPVIYTTSMTVDGYFAIRGIGNLDFGGGVGILGAKGVYTSTITATALANLPCIGADSNGVLGAGTCGGGGSSSLAVGTGTLTHFTNQVSSPTPILSFDGAIFTSKLAGSSTNFVSIIPGLYASASAVATDTNTVASNVSAEITARSNADTAIWTQFGKVAISTGAVATDTTTLRTDVNAKVVANGAITGATYTKITFDTKGLVTSGANATTADIAASTDKNYVTDLQVTAIGTIGLKAIKLDVANSTGTLQTNINNVGIATGTLNAYTTTQFSLAATSTGTLQSNIDLKAVKLDVATSTGAIATQFTAVATSTGATATKFTVVATSTDTLQTNINAKMASFTWPTCTGTDKLTSAGATPTCAADQGGAGSWGSITGTLSAQTDLWTDLTNVMSATGTLQTNINAINGLSLSATNFYTGGQIYFSSAVYKSSVAYENLGGLIFNSVPITMLTSSITAPTGVFTNLVLSTFTLPVAATYALGAAGQMYLDTGNEVIEYTDGTSSHTLSDIQTKDVDFSSPTAGVKMFMARAYRQMRIAQFDCLVLGGTSQSVMVQVCDANGANCANAAAALTCATTNTQTTTITLPVVDAGDYVQVLFNAVTGTVFDTHVTMTWREEPS